MKGLQPEVGVLNPSYIKAELIRSACRLTSDGAGVKSSRK